MRGLSWVFLLAGLLLAGWYLGRPVSTPETSDGGGDTTNAPRAVEREPVRVPMLKRGVPNPDNEWIELNNQAVEAIDAGDLEHAIELLEQCLEARPDEETFRVNLSRALVRRANDTYSLAGADPDLAIDDLARAIELDPSDEQLQELLDRWRRQRELEADFAGYESAHFSLSYDGGRDDLLHGTQDVVDVLERAYSDLWLATGHDPVLEQGRRVRIVLYRRENFHEATGLGHWAGGVYDGSIRLPIGDLEAERASWTRTLRHELTHAFVASLGGSTVPGWLNEGFAQWFEGEREFQLARARERVDHDALFGLDDLGGSLARLGEAESIARAYAQSLLLVDHLERFYGERLLGAMIAACGEGSSPQELFLERRGFELDRVLDDLANELERM